MSIKTRLNKLEVQAGTRISAEALRIADSAIMLGMIQPEEREQFAKNWRGFEHALKGLEVGCEAD
ncbi:MAG: hypothetical protein EOM37_15190 [Proteobacteria bacterium]|nr:hypothetical protein [Pseudomonadota bacterium]